MAAIGSDPITKEWWKVCEPCQESLEWTGPPPSEGGKGGNWWAPMEEVFHDGHPATQYKQNDLEEVNDKVLLSAIIFLRG